MSEVIYHSSSTLSTADFRYIRNLAKQNYVGFGDLCTGLEQQLVKNFGRFSAVLTGSGQGALALALYRLKSVSLDKTEVIVSAYVCPTVVNAILEQGLQPIFADVAPNSLNLNMSDVRNNRLTQQTLAILCTHIGGLPDDIPSAMQLGIPVISDCAQALGSGIAGRSLLAYGNIAITSFGSTKFLTGGLGGAVLCDEQDEESVRRLALPELSVAEYQKQGFVQTMGQQVSELNAGLALAQLQHLQNFVRKRRRLAQEYTKALHDVPGVSFPEVLTNAEPNWYRYYFFSDQASEWQRRLQKFGVDARTSISHVMTDYFLGAGERTELARQARRVLSLPIYPGLKAEQVLRIVEALQRIASKSERWA